MYNVQLRPLYPPKTDNTTREFSYHEHNILRKFCCNFTKLCSP